ncbi:MAG TPA: hypothetical protein PK530_06745, partial [Anaerolineales bacterium]|nr:hypothetical protein [Anaerolineales bacterium]
VQIAGGRLPHKGGDAGKRLKVRAKGKISHTLLLKKYPRQRDIRDFILVADITLSRMMDFHLG